MSGIEKLEDEEVRMYMKEVIVSMAAQLHDAKSVQDIQNKLPMAEEFDENFHKYSLIKAIKSSIESTFGSAIDKEMENLALKHVDQMIGQDNLYIDQISHKLLQSQE
ncbi:hypothetical protein HELRODRAFT_167544 [Helobdella robusta]|uniref:BROMI N-terminal domain-containing protein n=1 Tax=Helobdella robusta TaxID=6412 RepID=T1EZH1_HELRO|nr:hypothetical protein HELRODRAFT_167544 [Helobdella robusta]ESO11025.1 hypothetical protein HELRODRAFT_167544 [Helobdella robusta]